jgi:hypothetical protein
MVPIHGIGSAIYPLMASTRLGSLLNLRYAGALSLHFYASLLARINTGDLSLRFRDGSVRNITEAEVGRVLGLVSGRERIFRRLVRRRSHVIERVQELLGLKVSKACGISIEDLKTVLQNCGSGELSKKNQDAVKVAYTLLVCATFLVPLHTRTISEEVLACVLQPDRIGNYNWAGYVLELIRDAATKLQGDLADLVQRLILGGCNLFLQVFFFV